MDLFQVSCAAVLLVAYPLVVRAAPVPRRRLAEALILVVASWAGEQTCISAYGFYGYADGWWLRVGDVPLLVPLIWPMVILSARQVVQTLWPRASVGRRAALVGLAVFIDASLMEVIATSAGLWRWVEPGYLGVPLIGILGWGFFGASASAWLDMAGSRRAPLWLLPAVALAVTHALLLAAWWGLLRWSLRGVLSPAWAVPAFAGLSALAVLAVVHVRGRRRLPWDTVGARLLALGVFLGLLILARHQGDPRWLWIHTGLVAVPYLLAVRTPRWSGG